MKGRLLKNHSLRMEKGRLSDRTVPISNIQYLVPTPHLPNKKNASANNNKIIFTRFIFKHIVGFNQKKRKLNSE